MMSVAPRSFNAGISTLISDFKTTVSTANPPPPNSSETVGARSDGQEADHLVQLRSGDVELDEDFLAGFEGPLQQREQLFHRVPALGVGRGLRVGDELGARNEQGLDDLETGGPERPARLGDLDDAVRDLGDLGLGRAVGEDDVGEHAVLLEEPPGELGILGRRRGALPLVPAAEAARSATDDTGESAGTARTTRIGLVVDFE